MAWMVVSCVLFAVFLSAHAEPAAGPPPPQENRSVRPESPALFNTGRHAQGEALLLVQDYVKQGDTLLGERLKESFSSLKDLLRDGDAHLKERMLGGLAQVKAQLKDRDDHLKEELDEDVAWLKDKLTKGQSHLKEELVEEEAENNEEFAEQKQAMEKVRDTVKQWSQNSNAVIDDLKQQMSHVQEELKTTKQQLESTRTELGKNRETLHSIQADLQTNQADLHTTLQKMKSGEDEQQKTLDRLNKEVQTSTAVKAQLQAGEDEIRSLKEDVDRLLQSSHHQGLSDSSQAGSTFTRWGRKTCPDNTSLVYSGVAGGSSWIHTGGASNYLCLVTDPQLDDNTTVPKFVNYLYGAEYVHILGHHDQDVVCSVCRAPQATTLMIPATLTCPPGWSTQYQGHLVSASHNHKGRTEYVCLDQIREHGDDGDANQNGALFYLVVTVCGSLPCPPYVNNKVVTCVVCSK